MKKNNVGEMLEIIKSGEQLKGVKQKGRQKVLHYNLFVVCVINPNWMKCIAAND